MIDHPQTGRRCFRDPIPEIADAARYLDAAVSAHIADRTDLADQLIRLADMPLIREWTESLWGSKHPHRQYRLVPGAPPSLPREQRIKARMPTRAEKELLLQRDGYHCRFCGIPVIRARFESESGKSTQNRYRGGGPMLSSMRVFRRCGCNTTICLRMLEAARTT